MSRHNKVSKSDKSLLVSFKEEIQKLADTDLMSRSAQVAQELFDKKISRKFAVAQLASIASEINRRANPVAPMQKIPIPKMFQPVKEQLNVPEEVALPPEGAMIPAV